MGKPKKPSKTAHRAGASERPKFVKECPRCGAPMVATRLVKSKRLGLPGGMFWVCSVNGEPKIRV